MPASVSAIGLPVAYALFVWWFSTGLILYLDGLPRRTFRWTMLGATVVLLAALYGLARSAGDATVFGAYVAFTCGVLIWGWHETSFLMGFVTGPSREPCPEGATGWRRFGHAVGAILYHELAIAVTAVAVVAVAWGGANQVGAWTFVALWCMRLSAKFNLFLGVPNTGEEFLPSHLHHLKSFFARKRMNLLFPLSITASTIAVALLADRALAPDAGPFEVTACSFLGALLALAVLEHWFLVLPVTVAALWAWGFRSRAETTSGTFGVARAHGAVHAEPAFSLSGRRP